MLLEKLFHCSVKVNARDKTNNVKPKANLSTKTCRTFTNYCWFSHDVTKIHTKKLSFLPRFYFHDALEQLKTNFHTNFRLKRVLGFVIEYARISNLVRDGYESCHVG